MLQREETGGGGGGMGWGGAAVGTPVLIVCAKIDEYPWSVRQCCKGRERVGRDDVRVGGGGIPVLHCPRLRPSSV